MSLPPFRKLRGYAFDPSLSNKLDTHQINEIIYQVPWEEIKAEDGVLSGEYIEIVDYDPTVDKFYKSIDFNDPLVLAEHGLDPSESDPRFHQQMIYAVVMTTIKNFERALGRKVIWSSRRLNFDPANGKNEYEQYVDKLRIYPHALREANAYYSPQKKALLFGYFHSNPADQADQMPGSLVFTCLSHDIIAHETTHAILDGLQKNYNEPTNPDVLAFHEAFADIVSLFQHFSFPDVLKHQIARTRGDLSRQNLLGELAQQFGVAIGHYGSLRDAIGGINEETGEWEPKIPDPNDYSQVLEPHARGSILVAAVFEAFLAIYERRVADLYRIASNGTGVLPQGELHPDLVNRLAKEAAKTASHILNICIRAIDYCPPVDITFGDYLRALVTADSDVEGDDSFGYRLAFIEAFKKRGIYPSGIPTLSVQSLCYPQIAASEESSQLIGIIAKFLRDYSNTVAYHTHRKKIHDITKAVISGYGDAELGLNNLIGLHKRIQIKFNRSDEFVRLTGLAFSSDWASLGIRSSSAYGGIVPSFQVHSLRLVSRVGPAGNKVNQVVFSIVQRSGVVMKAGKVSSHFEPRPDESIPPEHHGTAFQFKVGCTLILDLDTMKLKYAIPKPILVPAKANGLGFILNTNAIERQWDYMQDQMTNNMNEFQQYFGGNTSDFAFEPFALLHQH
jgi:hypothetical protein